MKPEPVSPIGSRNRETELAEIDHIGTDPLWLSLYVDSETWNRTGTHKGTVTTWPGSVVGRVTYLGTAYRDRFGGWRRWLDVTTFTGGRYGGWLTSGKQFANVKRLKGEGY